MHYAIVHMENKCCWTEFCLCHAVLCACPHAQPQAKWWLCEGLWVAAPACLAGSFIAQYSVGSMGREGVE